jgi:hypothetical protein
MKRIRGGAHTDHEKNIRGKSKNLSGLKRGGPGRPKGVPNKVTIEAKEACGRLVDDPAYRSKLKHRLIRGKLAPVLEAMLWHYAKGKPVERVELKDVTDVDHLTYEQKVARLRELVEQA